MINKKNVMIQAPMRFFSAPIHRPGFSLIELSAVISIAAAIAVGTLSWSQPEQKTMATKMRETQGKMRELSEALEVFKVKFNRLPCPADPYLRSDNTRAGSTAADTSYTKSFGKENLDTVETDTNQTFGTDCPVNVGAVPIYDLELSETYMRDGWGRRFTYHISDKLCGADAGTASGLSAEISRKRGCGSYDYSSYNGDLTISNSAGDKIITSAAYVLVSHGANGYGAFLPSGARVPFPASHTDASEKENADNYSYATPPVFTKDDKDYVMAEISEKDNMSDDILLARTKAQTETLTSDENRTMLSTQQCNDIGAIMASDELKNLAEAARESDLSNMTKKGTANTGDTAIISILDALQRLCQKDYTSFTYSCPGGANWNATKKACECASGDWENC